VIEGHNDAVISSRDDTVSKKGNVEYGGLPKRSVVESMKGIDDMAAFDEDAFREDIAWRFKLVRGAAQREQALNGGKPDVDFGNDGLRFGWSLSAGLQGERTVMAPAIRTRLLEPWGRTTVAVNRVHSQLHLSPGEMLAASAWAEERVSMEAFEWAEVYRGLQRDLAGPAVQLTRRVESIRLDATTLAETRYMRSGWHTSVAELWLRLQHLAGCAYPLLPSFGTALWRALHLVGPPRWPDLPGNWAVRPVALRGILLEAPPSGEDLESALPIAVARRERFAASTRAPAEQIERRGPGRKSKAAWQARFENHS